MRLIVSTSKSLIFFSVFIALIAVYVCGFSSVAEAKRSKAKSKSNPRYAAFVMDVGTGAVLHEENAGKQLHPASLTKMMTLMMLFDAIQKGQVSLDDRIVISKHAASMAPSKLGLKPGSTIKVEDAIYALVTKSANDIAVAVGEHLGRTESNFASMMTKKAQSIGMTQTTFRNASGLHDVRQVSTARDMARLGYVLVTDYKRYYHYFGTRNFKYRGANYHNHNRLMETYRGMDGLKTGYIGPSGFNLVASAVRDNNRLIGVVFGGQSAQSRNNKMKQILDAGFARMRSGDALIALNDNNASSVASVPVPGKKPAAALQMAALTVDPGKPIDLGQREAVELAVVDDGVEDMGVSMTNTSRWAALDQSGQNSMFGKVIGEGDYDSDIRSRLVTGLIAISAHTGQTIPANAWSASGEDVVAPDAEALAKPAPAMKMASLKLPAAPEAMAASDWSIQVGAFANRDRTDKALADSLKKLPENLRSAKVVVAPVQTKQGWVFRARLNGYSKEAAEKACSMLPDCIAIPPNAF